MGLRKRKRQDSKSAAGNRSGLLVPLVIEECVHTYLTHSGQETKSHTISGALTVKNPSKGSRLWDVTVALENAQETSLEGSQISIRDLEPGAEEVRQYAVKASNIRLPIEVSELVGKRNDPAAKSHALTSREQNTVYFKITIKNASENPLTEVVVNKFISEGSSNVEVASVSSGEVRQGVTQFTWTIPKISTKSEACLELRLTKSVNFSSSATWLFGRVAAST